ncbi:Rrf2 family transcriptional regulator [Candidatus Woesebacteria bacterium]|nr:Rrf2 family transcriptional regulator [Candidatus Woesebacteria bacterium]
MSSFRFRKKTEYGMMMVSLLAEAGKDGLVSVRAMQENGLPRSFLVKIARDLIKAKLIVAKEGRGGGYSLTKEPSSITLKEVVEAVDGEIATASCLVHGAKKCPLADRCPHRNMMAKLTQEIGSILGKYKLSEFSK